MDLRQTVRELLDMAGGYRIVSIGELWQVRQGEKVIIESNHYNDCLVFCTNAKEEICRLTQKYY